MRWLERLENRLHWVAIPGLFKYLALLGVVVSAWQWMEPSAAGAIAFDREKILEGEFWRAFAFAFAPLGIFPLSPLSIVFLIFGTLIAFLVSDTLEEEWGATRTTLYILATWVGLVVGQFVFNPGVSGPGYFLTFAMFFAFATYRPKLEFRILFILPVQVRFLAWALFAILILNLLGNPRLIGVVAATLLPYGLWVLPEFLARRKTLAESASRRREFQKASLPDDSEPFHRCAVCQRTEKDSAELDFRTYEDGTEYCLDHLPEAETEARPTSG